MIAENISPMSFNSKNPGIIASESDNH